MKTGIEIIADERKRQVEIEGRTPKHDDIHIYEELSMAAICYAMPFSVRELRYALPVFWPFGFEYWKPSPLNRIKELAKAGALIAAEIDRIQRLNVK